ncbi:hypothetical protein OG21DRAFT_1576607 [Imleria badia]|nr:hypothetical protein OG21DRAFT_1576607 [Imleria badia]
MCTHWTPQNMKACIPILYHSDGLSVKEISSRLGIKKSLVYLVLKLYRQFGVVSNIHRYSCTVGRPRSLSQADLSFITTLLDHRRSLYLDELQDELWLKHGVHTTLPTIHCALQQLGISHKVISATAYERNEMSRAIYVTDATRSL